MPYKNPEDQKACRSRRYQVRKAELSQYYKKYREENREKLCEQKREYYQANKDVLKPRLIQQKKERRASTKLEAIEYKGGRCQICGYNRCRAALHFHHVDPSQKDPMWSEMKSWSFDRIKDELDKCMLLCSNCHAEIENPELVISGDDNEEHW